MHNLGTVFFFLALVTCTLFHGSLSEDLQSDHVCILDDQDSNQCDSFCLMKLRPLINRVARDQDQAITRDAATHKKLSSLESQLKKVEAKLEGQLQAVLSKVGESETKHEKSLLALEARLQNQLQAVLQKIENQLEAVSKNIDAVKVEIPDIVRIVNSGFERIGTRYFRIVSERVNWNSANKMCREMGGYLAAFRNKKEVNAVTKKLKQTEAYWLGINDEETEGHFVSVASKMPAQFLELTHKNPFGNCVMLNSGVMMKSDCTFKRYFICQADNKT